MKPMPTFVHRYIHQFQLDCGISSLRVCKTHVDCALKINMWKSKRDVALFINWPWQKTIVSDSILCKLDSILERQKLSGEVRSCAPFLFPTDCNERTLIIKSIFGILRVAKGYLLTYFFLFFSFQDTFFSFFLIKTRYVHT